MATGRPNVEIVSDGTYYGKECVRVMQHDRHGNQHSIKELLVNTYLWLATKKDYLAGDNSDVIATDSQKNTVYAVAKDKGISSPEQLGLDLCQHFLSTYSHVVKAKVYVEEVPWRRLDHQGAEHNHALIHTQEAKRFCEVEQEQGGVAKVWAGLSNMKIMKTTQSGFVGFVRDRFTSLPEVTDRIVCTSVCGKWSYSAIAGMDVDKTWEMSKNTILDVFAGPPDTGVYSSSIQHTMYLAAENMIAKIPQIDQVELEMPNIHYGLADTKKLGIPNNGEVMVPLGDPYGYVRVAVCRSPKAHL